MEPKKLYHLFLERNISEYLDVRIFAIEQLTDQNNALRFYVVFREVSCHLWRNEIEHALFGGIGRSSMILSLTVHRTCSS